MSGEKMSDEQLRDLRVRLTATSSPVPRVLVLALVARHDDRKGVSGWLRSLADAVDAGDVDAQDVAAALGSADAYSLRHVLAESENEGSSLASALLSSWGVL